jgi:hypothetical protein
MMETLELDTFDSNDHVNMLADTTLTSKSIRGLNFDSFQLWVQNSIEAFGQANTKEIFYFNY